MDTQKKYLVDLIVSHFGFPSNNRTEFIRDQQTFLPSLEETDWNVDSGATPPKLMLSFVGWYYSNGWKYSLRFGEMNELGEWRVKQAIVISIETGGCSILYSRQRPLGQCQKTIQMRLTLNTRLIDNNMYRPISCDGIFSKPLKTLLKGRRGEGSRSAATSKKFCRARKPQEQNRWGSTDLYPLIR